MRPELCLACRPRAAAFPLKDSGDGGVASDGDAMSLGANRRA